MDNAIPTVRRNQLALITGATSGIGAAFARLLAAEGYSLILHGRRRQRLEELAAELTGMHGVHPEILLAELSEDTGIRRVEERILAAPELSLLINNAGFNARGKLWEAEVAGMERVITVHCTATMRLTRAALPAMRACGRGGIINVSSVAGFIASPGSVNYAASKAYIIRFTEGLALELRGTGVRVQALCPGYTRTEFHSRQGIDPTHVPPSMWMQAEEVAAESLRCLRRGKLVCVPGGRNRFVVGLARWLPRPWFNTIMLGALRRARGRRHSEGKA